MTASRTIRPAVGADELAPAVRAKIAAIALRTGVHVGPQSLLLALATRKRPVQREHEAQRALIAWADQPATRRAHPELEMLYAVPNRVGDSIRSRRSQYRVQLLLQEGLRPGFPDLCLDVARGGFWGMRGELKVVGGKLTDNQRAWLTRLKAHGYYVAVAWGWEAMRDEILGYLELGPA